MNQEWIDWAKHNLQRGCDNHDIYNTLAKQGYTELEIQDAMGDAYPQSNQFQVEDYQTLAELPIGVVFPGLEVIKEPYTELQLFRIPKFLSRAYCQRLMELSETRLKPSQVTRYNGDDAFRTSETCDLLNVQDPLVASVDERIARTLGIRLPYSEPIQVQKYAEGQQFKPHTDFFQPHTKEYSKYAGDLGQRTWTFMVYLNDTEEGGGTQFVDIDKTFYPKQGEALVWNNLLPNGMPNKQTKHGGMPVKKGQKYIITKWFRDKGEGDVFYSNAVIKSKVF